MPINAQTREELRVAIVDGHTLEDFQVEVAERGSARGNIYRGTIAKIEPSLNAAFIDYGAERHGFLPIQDVVPDAWYKKPKKGEKRPRIEDVLERGKPIVVQVVKDAEAQKGAALTTNLSLAGRYLVLTPFDDTRGISRKVEDDGTRKGLKEQIKKLDVPEGCGVIVRTNALDQNKTALSRDLKSLLRLWKRVGSEARKGKGVKLIYSDQDLILQALRDYLDPDIKEILVDEAAAYARAEEYMKAYMPRGGDRLVRYDDRQPLFSRYELEPQIERIYERRVFLPSGGSIVIDRTEALTAIDVNSGRSTKASSQEQTALQTNLEAASEVARQLRLRDIGGLLVVDFIDMRTNRNQRKVEKTLKDAMKADKARFSVGRISSNGLLEINRQRIHQALSMRTHRTCPECGGTGRVPGPEMVGLNLLRRVRARAATASVEKVRIALHPELVETIQNQRRRDFAKLEDEYDLIVELVASPRLNLCEQEVEWVKRQSGNGRPQQTAVVSAASVQAGDVADDQDDDEEDEKPKRRRRSRSRGKGDGDDDKKAERKSTPRKRSGKSSGKSSDKDSGKRSSRSSSKASGGRKRAAAKDDSDDARKEAKKDTTKKAASDDDDEQKSTRRRRRRRSGSSRRRRRTSDSSGEAQGGDETQADSKSGDSGKDSSDDGGGRSRRRSTRSRSRSGGRSSSRKSAQEKPSGDSRGSDGGGDAKEDSSSSKGRSRRRTRSSDGDGGEPKGSARRRRSSRSRSSSSKGSDGKDSGGSDSAGSDSGGDGDGGGESKGSGRRRRSRRS